MDAGETRRWGGATKAERVTVRRAALLDAAFTVVVENGWRDLTSEAVARAAGLSKRFFYESFEGVPALAEAMVELVQEEIVAVTGLGGDLGRAGGRGVNRQVAATALDHLIGYFESDRRRPRVVFVELTGSPDAERLRRDLVASLASMLAAAGSRFHGEDGGSPVAALTASAILGGTIETYFAWTEGRIALTRPELVAHLADLWAAVGEYAAGGAAAG